MSPIALTLLLLAAIAYRIATKTRRLRVVTAREIREVAESSRCCG